MKKPLHQQAIGIATWLIAGLLAFGSLLDAVSNAFNFITLPVAAWTTLVLILGYSTLLVLFHKRKIKWVTGSGQVVTIREPGKKLKWSVAGALLLLWLPVAITSLSAPLSLVASAPAFQEKDRSFKILITRFDQECEIDGVKYYVGEIIYRRLTDLNEKYGLDLKLVYLRDSIDYSSFSAAKADSLMQYHHANQIIYGFYSTASCEKDGLEKICFNYRTDSSRIRFRYKQSHSEYEMRDIDGLNALREGTGQEDIDFIIYYFSGMVAYHQENYARSVFLFEKIKDLEKYESLAVVAAASYKQLKQYDRSRKLYDTIIQQNPRFAFGWNGLGNLHAALKDSLNAGRCFYNAISCDANNAWFWVDLGRLFTRPHQRDSARICFQKALAIDPAHHGAQHSFGLLYYGLGKNDSAQYYFWNALKTKADEYDLWVSLGTTYGRENNIPEALKCMEAAYKLNRDSNVVLFNYGQALFHSKKYDDAKLHVEKALRIQPNDVKSWNLLGKIEMGQSNFGCAKEYFDKAYTLDTLDEDVLYNLGLVYSNMQDFATSDRFFVRTLERHPASHRTLFALAIMNSFRQHREECMFYLKHAIRLHPAYKNEAACHEYFDWLIEDDEFRKLVL